jgi:hypothetical protein
VSNEELIARIDAYFDGGTPIDAAESLLMRARAALEAQSAPLVADSREALARWFAERRGHIVPRSGDVLNADALLTSGVVSLAADRDRAVEDGFEYRRVAPGGRVWFPTFDEPPLLDEGFTMQRRAVGEWHPYRESEGK